MQTGDTIIRLFRVPNPAANGANVDADSTPTAILRKDGVTVGAASVSVAKISTGHYSATVLLEAAHGWHLGDTWSIDVSYAVSTDSTTRPIAGGTISYRQSGDSYARLGQPSGDTIANDIKDVRADVASLTEDVAGLPTVITFWGGLDADQLAKFASVDTGESEGAAGSVAKLSQGSSNNLTAEEIAASCWSYTTRTLTQAAASIASALAGGKITIYRSVSMSLSITGLGSIADRDELWFSGKRDAEQSDSKAAFRISEGTGLERIAGGTPSDAADGVITVDDEDAGDITITLEAGKTDLLATFEAGAYDVKVRRTSGDVDLLTINVLNIRHPVTAAT